jgi:hypothetical protein
VVAGLLLAAFITGALIKPFPLGGFLVLAGFLGGVPLRR